MLPQNSLIQERKKKLRWLVSVSTIPLLSVVTAFGLVPHNEISALSDQVISTEVSLPSITPLKTSNHVYSHTERIQRGETVAEFLHRLGVNDNDASNYMRTDKAVESFRKLAVGREVHADTTADGGLISLKYLSSPTNEVTISKQGDKFVALSKTAETEERLFVRTGVIKTSLYQATDAAGMPEAAANQLTEIFSGDIDFHHDIKPGDRFTAVYKMTYSSGALVKTGRIQAAEFINQGHSYKVVYFQTDEQHGDYYTTEGKSARKAFLRSPIAFSRVSSGFTSARFHPVLNTWRAHKGTDFAAPTGTPVKSTSDGVIDYVGWQNGYGNVVIIKHQGRYSTVYGHLSRAAQGMKRGQRVSQGSVIGYVGMTGLASGPHLHYEFKIDGVQRDPLRVALPNAQPINDANRTRFQQAADLFASQLDVLRNTNLAKLD